MVCGVMCRGVCESSHADPSVSESGNERTMGMRAGCDIGQIMTYPLGDDPILHSDVGCLTGIKGRKGNLVHIKHASQE